MPQVSWGILVCAIHNHRVKGGLRPLQLDRSTRKARHILPGLRSLDYPPDQKWYAMPIDGVERIS